MAIATLMNWDSTRDAMHQIAQVVGAIRVACSDPLPNDMHFSLDVTATGISTTRMRCGGVLHFDFADLQLRFVRGDNTVFAFDVSDHSQMSLMRRLLTISGDCGYNINPSMKHITHDSAFEIEPAMAAEYLQTLNAVYGALARFRGKLSGLMTPLVLWPHHFDLAFIWFPSGGTNEHSDPHIAFGFAPFSPGLDRPYIYAYAWSEPTGYIQVPLKVPAQAISEPYTGLYVAYDDLRDLDDFDTVVERTLQGYQGLARGQFG